MSKYLMVLLFVLVNYLTAQEKVFIKNVPDYSQPPDSTIQFTRDQSNYCAPIAFANIIAYWDSVQNHAFARNVMGGLSGREVAEYIGWFMDTNDQGNPGRDNGTGRPSAQGTYGHDQWMGAQEYINFDSVNTFLYPDTIPEEKVGYGWDIQQVPVADFLILKEELDTYSPVKADFYYWNIIPTGAFIFDPLFYDDTVHIYDWGNRVSNSGSINEDDPLETWNLFEEDPGGNIGHAVTVVGYLENYNVDTSYVIVHDNWPNTPRNIAIPWLQGKVSSWIFAHLPKLPDLTIEEINTLIDTTKGYTDSLWVDQPATADIKIRNLGRGGSGSCIVKVEVYEPLGMRIKFVTKHVPEVLDAHGWGKDSTEIRFDSLFTPSQIGRYSISATIYWDQNRDGAMGDPADENPVNDTLSIGVNVYVESTSLTEDQNLITEFRLFQNYPNPFNPTTLINYELQITNEVDLSIYNLLGQKVITLVSEKQKAGHHRVEWEASDFPSGIYYYLLRSGEFSAVKKMVLIK